VTGQASRRVTAAAILLTAGTGAVDVVSFTRLGGAFASVMTANLVLLGLSIVQASAGLAAHSGLAVGSYVLGVAIAARLIAVPPRPREAARERDWPAMVTVVLALELVLLAGVAAGWELTGGHPAGAGLYLLQGAAAAAMGLQSAAVRALGAGEFSTTFMTGQLTGLVAALVTPGQRRWPGWQQPGPLLALVGGAVLGGTLIAVAPAAVPVIILAPAAVVLATQFWPRG
jgi:uncharacterized membrane protein YoaK (UPF0700 family)